MRQAAAAAQRPASRVAAPVPCQRVGVAGSSSRRAWRACGSAAVLVRVPVARAAAPGRAKSCLQKLPPVEP